MEILRKLKINIIPNVDFEIIDEKIYNPKNCEYLGLFAKCRVNSGKIAYIFDIFPTAYYLDKAQKEPLFNEICEFTHEKHTFQGSFIDALEYIKENFKG